MVEAEKECVAAAKDGRPWLDKWQKPLTGQDKRPDPKATGRKIKGKEPWVNWTKAELEKREKMRERECAIRSPILAEIKNRYPLIKPDPP